MAVLIQLVMLSDELRERRKSELERLGSGKGLMAVTKGDLSTEEVLSAAKRTEYSAWMTFEEWSETEENTEARELFKEISRDEKNHYESIDLDSDYDDDVPELHRFLRELKGTEERLGGVIGRGLVGDATLKQTVAFFTGTTDREYLELFREMREDTSRHIDSAEELLDTLPGIDSDKEDALETGLRVIDISYREYVDTLEGLGVNPKPLC